MLAASPSGVTSHGGISSGLALDPVTVKALSAVEPALAAYAERQGLDLGTPEGSFKNGLGLLVLESERDQERCAKQSTIGLEPRTDAASGPRLHVSFKNGLELLVLENAYWGY